MERSTGRIYFSRRRPQSEDPAQRPESEYDVDIYTIIFLALAVFIFLRLRSVLGQRTGNERPPFDRTAARNALGVPRTTTW